MLEKFFFQTLECKAFVKSNYKKKEKAEWGFTRKRVDDGKYYEAHTHKKGRVWRKRKKFKYKKSPRISKRKSV